MSSIQLYIKLGERLTAKRKNHKTIVYPIFFCDVRRHRPPIISHCFKHVCVIGQHFKRDEVEMLRIVQHVYFLTAQ